MKWHQILAASAILAMPAMASQFEFSTLVRWGGPGTREMGIGDSQGNLVSTAGASPEFHASLNRLVEVSYTGATNTAEVRVYSGSTSGGGSVSAAFNPVGTSPGAGATWQLPASSFFLQATADGSSWTAINLQNLSLITGTVLAPFQTTPLSTTQYFGSSTGLVNHTGDVSFLADSNGNWKLQGLIGMGAVVGTPQPGGLSFGLTATSTSAGNVSSVPEPISSAMIGIGLVVIAVGKRRAAK